MKLRNCRLAATFLILLPGVQMSAASLTVNEGSTENGYIPFHFYYLDNVDCRSQMIYPSDQLSDMKGQAITEIKFYINDEGYQTSWNTEEMILSLAETDETCFPGDLNEKYTDFLEPDWTVCYDGFMEGETGGRELIFRLTTPFTYTGSNLLMQISLGKAGNAYPKTKFLGVATELMQSAYTTNGYTTYGDIFLPQTTFGFGELSEYEATLSAEIISFPTTLTGKTSASSLKLFNSGKSAFPLTVSDLPDGFSLGSLPTTVESGETVNLSFAFAPPTAGEYSGIVTLDCGEAGSFRVALAGKAIDAPTGYSALFNLEDKELPNGWTGWEITKEYDFEIGDYNNIVDRKESLDYFLAYTKEDKSAVTVEEGNHIRDYPNMIFVYMISPEIDGNFIVTATATGGNAALHLYPANKSGEGEWSISPEEIECQWLSDPQNGWGLTLGSLSAPGYVAIDAVNMAIAEFNADEITDSPVDAFLPALSAESISFEEVIVGESAAQSITLTNRGTKPFTVTPKIADAELQGDAASFSIEKKTTTVEPGLSTAFEITFAPLEKGPITGTLTLEFEEGNPISVTLSGIGVAKNTDVPVGAEFAAEGLTYKVVAKGEVIVTGQDTGVAEAADGTPDEYVIPAAITHPDGETLNVVGIGEEAFYWSSVRKVTLPEGLRTIAYGAFRQSDLEEINLPSTLTTIDDYAFRTTKLTAIDVPEGITRLGSSVFAMCEQLNDVKLPSTLTSLGSGVFYKAGFKELTIPENCLEIGEEAFEACPNLTYIKLPLALTEIKAMTFITCEALESIELPEKLTKIGAEAFVNTGLTSLHLPAALESIASNSFTNSPIAEITVAAENTAFKTVDGVLYSKNGDFLYLYPRNEAEDYAVAEGTRGIIGGAFYKASTKRVSLPESLVGIDEMAFCNSALEEITIPESVNLIFPQAFAGTQLKELTLPSALTKVEEALVAGCEQLVTIILPEGMKDIGNRAFYYCTALRNIVCMGEIPSEFDGWEGLTDPFRGVDKSLITIYCPDNAVADYKESEWGDFFENIKGLSEYGAGVDAAMADGIHIFGGSTIRILADAYTAVNIFDMSGARVKSAVCAGGELTIDGLAPGLYIVKANDKVEKAMVF